MNRQQQIDHFLLAAHRIALARLRAQPVRRARCGAAQCFASVRVADAEGTRRALAGSTQRMTREQLEHVLRAAAAIAQENSLVVVGSVAARDKEADFVRVLLKEMMIDAETLDQRIQLLDAAVHPVEGIRAWARRRAMEASAA